MSTETLSKPISTKKSIVNIKTKTFTVGSLFAGIGGICQGFINSGFKIQWANEIDKQACITYRANFKHDLIEADITKLDPTTCPKVDIIAGGFPCQAFSVAGYRKGFTDTRGALFFDIMRFVDIHKPSVIFLENVKNIIGHDKGNTLKVIKEELSNRGYYFKYTVMNTAEYGNIPQNRERFYLVAFDDESLCNAFEFPQVVELTHSIKEYLSACDDERFFYTKNKIYPLLKEQMTKEDTLYQWERICA
ncbi:MAG: DNA (cytosine-5-)-methyltransferase [Brevinema sp.]